MSRFIWVFAGRTCPFVGFVVLRLICLWHCSRILLLRYIIAMTPFGQDKDHFKNIRFGLYVQNCHQHEYSQTRLSVPPPNLDCMSQEVSTKVVFEPPHDKTNKLTCAPSEDSDQPGHPSSLISVFAVRMKKAWVLSYPLSAQRRLWPDWADAQADLSLRWAHMPFCWFCHEAAHLSKNKITQKDQV